MTLTPYFDDGQVKLYLGKHDEVLPQITDRIDMALCDPPYNETSLDWDRWPDGWPSLVAELTTSMWCFGSLSMFLDRRDEFTAGGWKLSQDFIGRTEDGAPVSGDVHVVWEKHNGSSFHADRFKRVHEHAALWYRGRWDGQHRDVPTTADATARAVRRKERPTHTGEIADSTFTSEDGGPRLMRSVITVRSMHGKAIAPTQKPDGILAPLIQYSCPPGGMVLDPFAGSGSTLMSARMLGRRAIGIEMRESQAEKAALWLSQTTLEFVGGAL